MHSDKEQSMNAGLNEFIVRPCSDEVLCEVIFKYLENNPSLFIYNKETGKTADPEVNHRQVRELLPQQLHHVEDALKKSDWKKIRSTVHLMQPQLLDAGMNDLTDVLQQIGSMDGNSSYLAWHKVTSEFITIIKAKLSEMESA
jgi:hypothetical protein